jgi:hypothetical protein
MGYSPEKLKRVSLLLQRINIRVCPSQHLHLFGLKLHLLTFSRRSDYCPHSPNGAARLELKDLTLIVGQLFICNDLNTAERGTIIHFDERKAPLRVPSGPDPTHHGDFRTVIL